MKFFGLPLLAIFLLLCCKDSPKLKNSKTSQVPKDSGKYVQQSIFDPQTKAGFKVAAHLIYDDGTLSSFDVLNDKTIALWNVIAGGGDALRPSENTKISFAGNLDSLNIKIKNGQKPVIDTILFSNSAVTYTIKNTGCEEIYIGIVKDKRTIYKDTIPFHCGE
jgi:hypothetical protein